VDIRSGGVERSIEVGADGVLLTRQVFPSELPPIVQQSINQLQRFGPVGDIYWVDDDGEVNYAVEVTAGGVKRYYTVDLSGWLLATPLDQAQAPYAIQRTIQAQLGQGTLVSIDRVDDYGDISFEAVIIKDNRRRTFDMNQQGAIIMQQVYPDEISPAAQATIQKLAAGTRLAHIDLVPENGENFYDIRVVKNGVTRSATIGQDGNVTSVQIDVSQVPELVRQTLQQRAIGARVVKIEKVFDEKSASYDVELTANGLKIPLTISEDGSIQK
jgi:uncharacterized membrane protein YkoI